MRFLKRDKVHKTILVISDVHLGAGEYVGEVRNILEDFHYDEELVEFLEYFTKGEYAGKEVELIINGDFFDLLAVPFVKYYDDEFWSEDATKEKMALIIEAHPEVMDALGEFLKDKSNKITFIIGNHDAELIFDSLQEMVLQRIPEDVRERFSFYNNPTGEYRPADKVLIKHGHEYEVAHQFDYNENISTDESGRRYFIPPWGSYYVTRVINKFKEERDHVNAVRPIYKFLINGLIYDTFFTIRFMLANFFYFMMVRTIYIFKQSRSIKEIMEFVFKELELFADYESLTYDFLNENKDTDVLIVGHTHEPIYRSYNNGKTFINTGTWTKMYHLDFGKGDHTENLTFAKIDILKDEKGLMSNLYSWKGVSKLPYSSFS